MGKYAGERSVIVRGQILCPQYNTEETKFPLLSEESRFRKHSESLTVRDETGQAGVHIQ
jgi:hypothetical protein